MKLKPIHMNLWVGPKSPQDGGPACGTIGCFAGWVSLLAGAPLQPYDAGAAETYAKSVLGHGCNYYDTRIDRPEMGSGYVFNANGEDLRSNPGTKTYARSVIARIKRFQKTNAAYLKAQKLAGVK